MLCGTWSESQTACGMSILRGMRRTTDSRWHCWNTRQMLWTTSSVLTGAWCRGFTLLLLLLLLLLRSVCAESAGLSSLPPGCVCVCVIPGPSPPPSVRVRGSLSLVAMATMWHFAYFLARHPGVTWEDVANVVVVARSRNFKYEDGVVDKGSTMFFFFNSEAVKKGRTFDVNDLKRNICCYYGDGELLFWVGFVVVVLCDFFCGGGVGGGIVWVFNTVDARMSARLTTLLARDVCLQTPPPRTSTGRSWLWFARCFALMLRKLLLCAGAVTLYS